MLPTLTVKQKIVHQEARGSLPVTTMHIPKDNVESHGLYNTMWEGQRGWKKELLRNKMERQRLVCYQGSKVKAKLDKIKC